MQYWILNEGDYFSLFVVFDQQHEDTSGRNEYQYFRS